jgi:hypothetical protein
MTKNTIACGKFVAAVAVAATLLGHSALAGGAAAGTTRVLSTTGMTQLLGSGGATVWSSVGVGGALNGVTVHYSTGSSSGALSVGSTTIGK